MATPELEEALQGLVDGSGSPEPALLEEQLSRDSEVPEVHNGAALALHRRSHENSGAYVIIHCGPHAPTDVGKAMALAAPDESRVFRRGGPHFVAWLNDAPEAEEFNRVLRLHTPGVVSGAGYSFSDAARALESGAEGDELHTSFLGGQLPQGWRRGTASLRDARQLGLGFPILGDAVGALPGSRQHLYPITFGAAPAGADLGGGLEKAEGEPHEALRHPMFSGQPFAIIGAEAPRYAPRLQGGDAMRQHLLAAGIPHEEIRGHYDGPQKSFVVHGISVADASRLARDFGQESFIHGSGGQPPALIYVNGPHADHYHPGRGFNFWTQAPRNHWSQLGSELNPLYFNVDVDWNQRLPLAGKQ